MAESGSAVDDGWSDDAADLVLEAATACWLRAVLMRSSAPLSVVDAREALGPSDKLGSGVDVPDSRADDAKDGRQNEPKASWYGSVPLFMDTGERSSSTVIGGGGSSMSSSADMVLNKDVEMRWRCQANNDMRKGRCVCTVVRASSLRVAHFIGSGLLYCSI